MSTDGPGNIPPKQPLKRVHSDDAPEPSKSEETKAGATGDGRSVTAMDPGPSTPLRKKRKLSRSPLVK